jgi:hypothetical protein
VGRHLSAEAYAAFKNYESKTLPDFPQSKEDEIRPERRPSRAISLLTIRLILIAALRLSTFILIVLRLLVFVWTLLRIRLATLRIALRPILRRRIVRSLILILRRPILRRLLILRRIVRPLILGWPVLGRLLILGRPGLILRRTRRLPGL